MGASLQGPAGRAVRSCTLRVAHPPRAGPLLVVAAGAGRGQGREPGLHVVGPLQGRRHLARAAVHVAPRLHGVWQHPLTGQGPLGEAAPYGEVCTAHLSEPPPPQMTVSDTHSGAGPIHCGLNPAVDVAPETLWGKLGECPAQMSYSNLPLGRHVFVAVATDRAGNKSAVLRCGGRDDCNTQRCSGMPSLCTTAPAIRPTVAGTSSRSAAAPRAAWSSWRRRARPCPSGCTSRTRWTPWSRAVWLPTWGS